MKFLIGLLLAMNGMAGTVEKTIEVTTKEKNPNTARRELADKAQTKIIEDMILETIGEERYQKNKHLVETKILKLAPRLIPFSKMGNLEQTPEGGHKISAVMKVNQDELDQVLLQNGLFYESDVQPLILPIVSWNDKTESQTWGWWMQNASSPLIVRGNTMLENSLRSAFLKNGFFVLKPQLNNAKELLTTQPGLNPGAGDMQTMAGNRGAQVVLTGEIQIANSETRSSGFSLEIKMSVLHVPRNRTLAQVARKIETDAGAKQVVVVNKLKDAIESMASDLSGQTLEAWQRGSAQSNFYRISLLGPVPLNVQEGFREAFKNKVREVKSIRERLITAQGVTFEIDSVTGPKDLAKRVSEIPVDGGKLVLKDVSDTELKYSFSK